MCCGLLGAFLVGTIFGNSCYPRCYPRCCCKRRCCCRNGCNRRYY
ncbi:hypothetical protein [Sedimentibacter sp. zth1]|nr:hypothetical protein [Sedimentibacter sp. zth1]